MTRDEAREAVKVLQHYADGGEIDGKGKSDDEWYDVTCAPSFNFERADFRIKPKPAEGWGTITDSDPNSLVGWASEKVARGFACNSRRAIHWREVEQ